MSAPSSGRDGDENGIDPEDLDDLGEDPPPGDAASDPEAARREAEDALAKIEALADLDEDPETASAEGEPEQGDEPSDASGPQASTGGASEGSDASVEDQAERCGNCGAPLDGPYCSECGQEAADRVVPLWYMFNDALETIFNLDLRAFRTFPKLLFLPGRLTKEYINGRRKRYVRPFRLYLVATFVLFAVLAVTTTGSPFSFIFNPQGAFRLNPPNTDIGVGSGARVDTTTQQSTFGPPAERKRQAERIRSDTSFINLDVYDDPTANDRLERYVRHRLADAVADPWGFVRSMIDRGPYLMFFMLPIFALLMKLLYIRRGRLYMEHLIFSLHVHAYTFFALTVGLLLHESSLVWIDRLAIFVELSPLLYLVLAMRHVYEQGVIKSSIKATILLWIYSFVLSIAFTFLMVAVIFWS